MVEEWKDGEARKVMGKRWRIEFIVFARYSLVPGFQHSGLIEEDCTQARKDRLRQSVRIC
jgi:hypothetical protein